MSTDHTVIQVAKKISELYKTSIESDLKDISSNIEEELRLVFSEFDEDFHLIYNDKKYYSFTYRVKKENSLYEKLHRKNLIFDLIKELNINNLSDIQENILVEKIKNFDDNIGFRIICDLQEDVENVFNLLKDKESEFKNFKFKNLSDQPGKMKNGHIIYKIEVKYNDIPFELQIKNKLDSAWGDMEHDLYYKNNKINIVKEINKLSFNHLGIMLKQIDDYMSKLRKMNQEALTEGINTNNILTLGKIEERYEKPLKDAISSDFIFNFGDISDQLIFMTKDKIESAGGKVHISRIINDFLKEGDKRHNSWAIIILEAIYRDLINDDDTSFIEAYKEFIYFYLNIQKEQTELQKFIELTYTKAIKEKLGSEHLLQLNQYKNLHDLGIFLTDIMINEVEIDNSNKESLFKYFGYKYFRMEITNSELDELDELDEIIEKIEECLKSRLEETKLSPERIEQNNEIKIQLGLN